MYRRNCLKIRTEVAHFYIEMEYILYFGVCVCVCMFVPKTTKYNKTQDKWWNVTLKKINVIVHGNGHYNNIRIESYGTTNNAHLPWSSSNVNWKREIWWKNTQVNVCVFFFHLKRIKKQQLENPILCLKRHSIQF